MDDFVKVFSVLQLIVVWINRKTYILDIDKMYGNCRISKLFLSYLIMSVVTQFKNELISAAIKVIKSILKALLQQPKYSNQKLVTWIYCMLTSSFYRTVIKLLWFKR